MAENSKTGFYITTPIYYVNDVPHIGHAYTTIIADAVSRYKRLAGHDVFFLTGTDEHGQKIEKSAAEKGLSPIELADRVVQRFQDLWKALDISYDHFIRTTHPSHEKGVRKIFARLRDQGDIYKGTYRGYYCVSDEFFLPEDVPLEQDGGKICPDCGRRAGPVEEECYFFRLSAFQDRLLEFYERNPEFVRPASRMNEVVSFVRQGLKDLCITRTTVKWGIQTPDDPDHTIYVWFDALHNYLTGIGFDVDPELFNRFWPADAHLIGKDILRYHAVYWPAFLMAGGFAPPKMVFGHGWWLKDDSKMSKSKGNVLDPRIIIETFGPDPLRYFLLREIPIGLDGNFSHEGFLHRVNSDLANDLGNLVQRTLTMIRNYFGGRIDRIGPELEGDAALRAAFESAKARVVELFDEYAMNKALEEIWQYVGSVNRYLADNEPWKLAKEEGRKERLGRVLYQAAGALRGISLFIAPVMPGSAQKIWDWLAEPTPLEGSSFDDFDFRGPAPDRTIGKPEPLFPRVDLDDFLKDDKKPGETDSKEDTMGMITFEEFKKLDLRVGEILQAEKVEGTDKLLKMEVDIGTEKRTMIAGIAQEYSAEDMVGKKMIVIVNLQPATIRGIESQAMLLAAEDQGKAIVPFFTVEVPTGAKVR